MADTARPLTIGFPRMHKEPGERRDFLLPFVGLLTALGAEVHIETGMGSGMGYADHDYTALSPDVHVTDEDGAYRQDVVVVLRAPEGRYEKMRSGTVLVSMLHFATRPARVALLRGLGIDAISMDLIANDEGRRLVENLRSVAWNGVGAAFAALERTWPGLSDPHRPPVRVTIMGAGTVGKHAVEFATKFGDDARNEAFMRLGLPGVEVVTTGRNLTQDPAYFRARLAMTDLLVDATQRRDPSISVVRNEWIGLMPPHAVLCDLIVDPYLLDVQPAVVRGIEGIPQGNLDQWEFAPDDPAWDALPSTVPTTHRRTVVSCYSWPGVRPEPCMHVYGSQLAPLLETLVLSGGMGGITAQGSFHARALWRGSLRAWPAGPDDDAPDGQVPSGLVPGAPAVDSGEADMTAQPGRASVTEAGQLHAGRRSPGLGPPAPRSGS
jgi:alanine dehydrogenase